MTATAVAASFIKLWAYKMSFTLAHYDFANMDGGGWWPSRTASSWGC